MYEEDYIPTTTTEDPDYYDVFSILGKRSAPSFTGQDNETNVTQSYTFQYIEYPNLSKISRPSFLVRFLVKLFQYLYSLVDKLILLFDCTLSNIPLRSRNISEGQKV